MEPSGVLEWCHLKRCLTHVRRTEQWAQKAPPQRNLNFAFSGERRSGHVAVQDGSKCQPAGVVLQMAPPQRRIRISNGGWPWRNGGWTCGATSGWLLQCHVARGRKRRESDMWRHLIGHLGKSWAQDLRHLGSVWTFEWFAFSEESQEWHVSPLFYFSTEGSEKETCVTCFFWKKQKMTRGRGERRWARPCGAISDKMKKVEVQDLRHLWGDLNTLNSSFSEESRKWHMAFAFSEEMRAWHVSSAGDTLQMAPPQRGQAYLFCRNLGVTHVSYFSEKSRERHVSGYFSRRREGLTRVPCRRHTSSGATSEETSSTFSRQDNLWHLASPGSLGMTHGAGWIGWHMADKWDDMWRLLKVAPHWHKRMAEERRWHVAPTLGEPYADTWQVNGRREKRQVAPIQGTRLLYFWVFFKIQIFKRKACVTPPQCGSHIASLLK